THLYTGDNNEWFPPMQDFLTQKGFETSWRSYLFPLVAQNRRLYDCPVEKEEVYALGARAKPKPPRPEVIGLAANGEIELLRGWPGGPARSGQDPVRHEQLLVVGQSRSALRAVSMQLKNGIRIKRRGAENAELRRGEAAEVPRMVSSDWPAKLCVSPRSQR